MTESVLIIDDDHSVTDVLVPQFGAAGVFAEVAGDGFAAIEKLQTVRYGAVILDPMIRHGLNGYAVLNFIELEQPELVPHLFLLTSMSHQTISRTAPALLPRLFRKPADIPAAIAAVLQTFSRAKATSSSRSVLIVEDDRVSAEALSRLTAELGYDVTVVESGRDALKKLASHCYAAILLDLVLPDIDGFAILKYLEDTTPNVLPRVIITTGMPQRYSSPAGMRVCALLQKPVDMQQLVAALRRCDAEPSGRFDGGGETPEIG